MLTREFDIFILYDLQFTDCLHHREKAEKSIFNNDFELRNTNWSNVGSFSVDVESSKQITVNVEEDEVEAFEEESLVEVDYFDEFLKERIRYFCLDASDQIWL